MSFPSTSPGNAPLGYLGTDVANPMPLVKRNRDPNPSDARTYNIGTIWLNISGTNNAFILTAKPNNIAVWKQIT